MDRHVVVPGVLHAAQVQHLGAAGGHLQHLLVTDPRDPPGAGDNSRVGGEDAVYVGVDLAQVGAERGGQRHCRGVRPAAAKCRDVLAVLRHALEAGHDRDRAIAERAADPARSDVDDPGLAVGRVRDHSGLRPGERPGLEAQVGDRHRYQRHRDPFPGGQQHVEFTSRRQRAHFERQVLQLVGRVAHRRYDHDHTVTGLAGGDNALRDPFDAVGVGERRAAILLHDKSHGA